MVFASYRDVGKKEGPFESIQTAISLRKCLLSVTENRLQGKLTVQPKVSVVSENSVKLPELLSFLFSNDVVLIGSWLVLLSSSALCFVSSPLPFTGTGLSGSIVFTSLCV